MSEMIEKLKDLIARLKPTARVLVIDDEPAFVDFMVQVLSLIEKLTIDQAANGKLAIDKLNENKYDVVFVDLNLPIVSGYEVLRHMKATKNGIAVVLSGFVDRDMLVDCGAFIVIDKLDSHLLVEVVEMFRGKNIHGA